MHGMIEIVTPAWSMPQSVPPRLVSVRAAARMTGSVNADSLLVDHERAEQLVPRRDEREQGDRHDRRHDGRQEHPGEDLPRVAAVDDRGLLELARAPPRSCCA